MRGKIARKLRDISEIDKKEFPTKYFHYNAQKAAKKIKASTSDPIIADTRRQIYQAAKKYFKLGFTIPVIRNYLSQAATERMNQGKA